ncbi:hypothetical protein QVD17_18251 [Tagetes erecta]|uniref:FAM50A/XAP5 C-terminal domain-containing protein n=1 Tax=Tagetes erecta TaxID=13708 RepID=A0AAD8NW39_TARER|nr:hypothetical protein QVD17_18251 [Tagetes erecta]
MFLVSLILALLVLRGLWVRKGPGPTGSTSIYGLKLLNSITYIEIVAGQCQGRNNNLSTAEKANAVVSNKPVVDRVVRERSGVLSDPDSIHVLPIVYAAPGDDERLEKIILETAFKKETVGLVTREQYVEKRVNIRTKIEEEEEKEKLQKLQQEEEELQLQKLKKRKIKANPRLSFSEDVENGEDEEDGEDKKTESNMFGRIGFGKDPTVETSFLPDSEREAEEQAERERLRKQWLREQEQIKNEALEITYSYWDGAGHRRVMQVRKGDTIGEFLRAVQQQLAPEFREIRTTSVENLLYV